MRNQIVVLSLGLLGWLASAALAQPVPTPTAPNTFGVKSPIEPPPLPDPRAAAGMPGVDRDPEAAVVDPAWDSDPDIDDDYGAEYDLSDDNSVAQSYDDGYDPGAYDQFDSTLAPYGDWVNSPDYGRVWVPSNEVVGADFSPYATGGHWVLTEYGWTWASDWDWGWAPFHYGRWAMTGGYGWCWVPGTAWGPAWVSWRSGGGYVGWAPLPPRGVTVGPPQGVRSSWRFSMAADLGAANPRFLPAHVVPSVFARTQVISNVRSVAIAGGTVRINAGPTQRLASSGGPTRLQAAAPTALPRVAIAPRLGTPLAVRPWVRPGVAGVAPVSSWSSSVPIHASVSSQAFRYAPTPKQTIYIPPRTVPAAVNPYGYAHPGYWPGPAYRPVPPNRTSAYSAASTYAAPHYAAPAYSAPHAAAPNYAAPHYSAPVYSAPHYNPAPTYSNPAPTYSAPHYSAPVYSAPHVSAPAYSTPHVSAPNFSHPASGGGFHGGRR